MTTMQKALSSSVAMLTLAVAAAGQIPQSGGPLAGAAVAFSIDGGSASGPDASTVVHKNGFGGPPVAFPAVPGSPNLQTILAGFGAPNLDIDDISTGRDDVLVDGNGVLDVPPGAWGVLSFSVRNGAVGQPGSRLALEAASGSVGAVVFSWVLPGSAVPVPLTNTVERSHSRQELGLPLGTGVLNLDALDLPVVMGFEQSALGVIQPGFQPLLPSMPAIYFTLSSASAPLAPAGWWLWNGQPTMPSGATILMVEKTSPFGPWGPPRVFEPFFELGLQASEDIDGLAYDAPNEKLLFSCVGTARDQLLFLDLGTDGGGAPVPVPMKKADNTPVSDAVGTAQGDDIDAVCTLDPHVRNGVYLPDDFGATVGTPRDPYQPAAYPVGMSASAYRRYEAGQRFFDTWLLGYPPAVGQGPGFAVLAITLGDTLAPVVTASFQARNPTSAIPGDPRSYSMFVPQNFSLIGMAVTFRWFAADAGFVQLAQAYPLKVFL